MNKRKYKKYAAKNVDNYNTIDDIDDYMRGVIASDSFRIMRFNGNG